MRSTLACTAGMRVDPPTSSTWSRSLAASPASRNAFLTGSAVRSMRSAVISSNAARVSVACHVQRPRRTGRDERQVDLGLARAGQFLFGFFGFLPDALHGDRVSGEVDPLLGFEVIGQPAGDALVKIITAEVVVAAGGEHLNDVIPISISETSKVPPPRS